MRHTCRPGTRAGAAFGTVVPHLARMVFGASASPGAAAPRSNTVQRLADMGRILSGGRRGMYVADPGSAGASGRFLRRRIVHDIEHVADDMITILKMSPDDRLKEHVRRQVARVVEYDGGHVGAGAACGGGGGGTAPDAGDGADAVCPAVDAGAVRGVDAGSDEEEFRDDLEAEMWGDTYIRQLATAAVGEDAGAPAPRTAEPCRARRQAAAPACTARALAALAARPEDMHAIN